MKKKSNLSTISDKITNYMTDIYKNYIENNKVIVIIIIIVFGFLLYRYYNKKNNDKKEKFTDQNNLFDEITSEQTKHLMFNEQPTFNPLYSIAQNKQDKVYYPPDPLPINIPNDGIVYRRNLYADPHQSKPFNYVNYDYDNVYKNPSRSYYYGTNNTYYDAQDPTERNPLWFANDFNTSTGDFVGAITDTNNQVITNYQSIINNMQGSLQDSLKLGPKHLNPDHLESTMEPPYATDYP